LRLDHPCAFAGLDPSTWVLDRRSLIDTPAQTTDWAGEMIARHTPIIERRCMAARMADAPVWPDFHGLFMLPIPVHRHPVSAGRMARE
jgi:hypothetical protein